VCIGVTGNMLPRRSQIRRNLKRSFNVSMSLPNETVNAESLQSDNFLETSTISVMDEEFPRSSPPRVSSSITQYDSSLSTVFDEFPSSPVFESFNESSLEQGMSLFRFIMTLYRDGRYSYRAASVIPGIN
jgi:hypothetical protein